MKASRTLAAGSRGELRKRQRFSRQAASESNQDEPAAEEYHGFDPEKDIADQHPWDLDHVRSVWNRMNDKALKIAGGRANAFEVLEAMSVIQDGNLELERRASQAKAANETFHSAVEYLSKTAPDRAGKHSMHFDLAEAVEVPSEAVQACIDHLRQRVTDTVDLDGIVEGPAPDELEEECQELEKLVAEQAKHMEAYRRQRERTAKFQQELEETKNNDGIEDQKANAQRSTLVDPRLDARLQETAPSKASQSLTKMKRVAQNAAMLAKLSNSAKAKRQGRGQETEFKDDGKFDQDPKVLLLREHIMTKDQEIQKAKALLLRMRREKRLLKYCSEKANAGFDAFVADFNPPKSDDPVNSGDDSDELDQSDSVAKPADDSGTHEKVIRESTVEKSPSTDKVDSEDEPSSDPQDAESTQQLAERKKRSPKRQATGGAEKKLTKPSSSASSSSTPKPPAVVEKIREAEAASDAQNDEIEAELQSKLYTLQSQLNKDMDALKEEKGKSRVLRKEIKDLRKEFAFMTNNDRSAPQSLEALTERIAAEAETESRIRAQMAELESELQSQAQQLEEAKAEQKNARIKLLRGAAAEASEMPQPQAQLTPPPPTPPPPTPPPPTPPPEQKRVQDAQAVAPPTDVPADAPSAAPAEPSKDKSNIAETMLSMRRARALEAAKQAVALADPQGNDKTAKQNLDSGSLQHGESSSFQTGPSPIRQVTAEVPETTAKLGVGFAAAEAAPEVREATSKRSIGFGAANAVGESVVARETSPKHLDSSKERAEPFKGGAGDGGAQETLAELVKVQSKTEELRNEISDIDQKMKRLKQAMKNKGGPPMVQVVRDIMGVTQAVDRVKPPAEYFALKKDLKLQQEKIRSMRKRWWLDRRDFEALAEKVRHQVGAGHGNMAGVYQTSSSSGGRSQPQPFAFAKFASLDLEGPGDGTENQFQNQFQKPSSKVVSAKHAADKGGPMKAAMAEMLPVQFSALGSGLQGRQTAAQFPGQLTSVRSHDQPAPEAPPRRLPAVFNALSRTSVARGGPRQRFEQIRRAAAAADEMRTPAQAVAAISAFNRDMN
eukprot:TRINITY_DN4487_c0_g1_i3.p1 TRINITY_DN4487_c0_g1~~TRINITY_DN4487_c0_g1_i3.p1  ORF type:complete len:1064 (-),score=247.82 TRINITY_DN4487_c0_g1_i3:80-3271(-)